MIVPLIPLFFAASINITESSDWKYGPEVIYNVTVDGELPSLDTSGCTVVFNTTVKLACRLKSESIVICTFNKPTVVLTSWKTVEGHRVFENIFEIDFHKNNESPPSMTTYVEWVKLNFERALVNELTVASNLTTNTDKTFIDRHYGLCRATYVRSSTKVAEDDAKNTEENGRVSMIILPDAKVLKGEILEIQKKEDIGSCFPYYSRKGFTRRIISSKNHMIVSESNFTSYTDNKVGFYKGQLQFFGREIITVTLDKVVPAEGPLPTVSEPHKFRFEAARALHNDSIDISYGKELYDDWLAFIGYEDNKCNIINKKYDIRQYVITARCIMGVI